jgi:predicted RNA-binding Zn-ribbon protein involved in translation (DUF1610 family)
MAHAVECGGCGKALQADLRIKEFDLRCDKCGHEQTYRSSDVKMRQLQI